MNQVEYDQLRKYLESEAMTRLGITKRAATCRINALMKSGILSKFGPPDGVPFQAAIDAAMQIPQLGESEVAQEHN